MDVRAFIPSILWRLRPARSSKVYDSYEHALADSHTYEDPGVIQVVSSKTEAHKNALPAGKDKTVNNRQTVQNMFVLSYIWHDRPLDVLEIGGACGATYFELSHLLPGRIKSWHVVETPAMAAAGRRLIRGDRLTFYDALDTAVAQLENLDLLIAQGVLQYLRDPLQTLEALLKLGFTYVYVTRTVVGDSIQHPIITKQIVNLSDHGPGAFPKGFTDRKTSQPLTIVPFESIASRISVGHTILYSFMEGENASMRIGSRTVTTTTLGFLLEKVGQ